MKRVFIGLGSNLNNPVQQIKQAVLHLAEIPNTRLDSVSSIYASKPMGPEDQPDFMNAAALLTTRQKPLELLQELKAIEAHQQRIRTRHWGPRTIDLDILLFGEDVIDLPELRIPHPGLTQRSFVLHPLFEIAPALILPNGEKLSDLVMNIESLSVVV